MVYQGTVWGPWLWNIFFCDAADAIHERHYQEIVFADDLNAFKIFDRDETNSNIYADLRHVQQHLHRWGDANQ
eukprot:354867-Karenia_brevis.AAC.1